MKNRWNVSVSQSFSSQGSQWVGSVSSELEQGQKQDGLAVRSLQP